MTPGLNPWAKAQDALRQLDLYGGEHRQHPADCLAGAAAQAVKPEDRSRSRWRPHPCNGRSPKQQANAADSRLIRQGSWVRRRRNGTSPQFGSARSKASARKQRSAYRGWL